jgi:hypothetical protein
MKYVNEMGRRDVGSGSQYMNVQRQTDSPTALPARLSGTATARDKRDTVRLSGAIHQKANWYERRDSLGLIPALCRDTQAKQSDV